MRTDIVTSSCQHDADYVTDDVDDSEGKTVEPVLRNGFGFRLRMKLKTDSLMPNHISNGNYVQILTRTVVRYELPTIEVQYPLVHYPAPSPTNY